MFLFRCLHLADELADCEFFLTGIRLLRRARAINMFGSCSRLWAVEPLSVDCGHRATGVLALREATSFTITWLLVIYRLKCLRLANFIDLFVDKVYVFVAPLLLLIKVCADVAVFGIFEARGVRCALTICCGIVALANAWRLR